MTDSILCFGTHVPQETIYDAIERIGHDGHKATYIPHSFTSKKHEGFLSKGFVKFANYDGLRSMALLFKHTEIGYEESHLFTEFGFDYIPTRANLEHRGDGQLAVWVKPGDHVEHFLINKAKEFGPRICCEGIPEKYGVFEDIRIREIIIAGSSRAVYNAGRRYRFARRNDPNGHKPFNWEAMAESLHMAVVYLVTTENVVLQLTRAGFSFVRPERYVGSSKGLILKVYSYKRVPLATDLPELHVEETVPNDFMASMRKVVTQHHQEAEWVKL